MDTVDPDPASQKHSRQISTYAGFVQGVPENYIFRLPISG